MCLAVYANGVGAGAGTHISLSLLLLSGEYDHQLKWPMHSDFTLNVLGSFFRQKIEAVTHVRVELLQPFYRPARNELKEIHQECKFCPLESDTLKLVDNCLILKIRLYRECYDILEII